MADADTDVADCTVPAVVLRVVPSLALEVDSRPLAIPSRVRRLLALLAVHDGAAARHALAGALWPDSPLGRATSNLSSTLWLVPERTHVIALEAHRVALAPRVRLDLRELRLLARRILDGHADLTDLLAAAERLSLDIAEDEDEPWLDPHRDSYRQLRLHALEAASAALSDAGRHWQAVQAAQVALAGDALRESAHAALMAAHLAEGNRAEALRQFERCAALLETELRISPGPGVWALRALALDGPDPPQDRLP